MLKFEPGTLVRSLAGHDKGKLYIIIEERYPMLLLAGRSTPYHGEAEIEESHAYPAYSREVGNGGIDG